MSAATDSEPIGNRLRRACEAIDKGSCLELYYGSHSVVVEAHAAGFDKSDRPVVLAWERITTLKDDPGKWQFLRLDETRKVTVSGYFSDAPRAGFERGDKRFRSICCQV